MPRLSELLPGDLISDIDDDDHFMMWVGGHEAVVENVEANKFSGVFRHSDSKIRKRIEAMEAARAKAMAKAAMAKAAMAMDDDDEKDDDDELEGFDVFRCQIRTVGDQAAAFAIQWSTGKSDPLFVEGMESFEKTENEFKLKVPFNQSRLTHERQQPAEHWDARSLFRALRVLARHDSGVPVSVKGWTCSSFGTYCYQAAMLKVLFKDGPIRPGMLDMVRRSGSTDFLSIKSDLNIIQLIFSDLTEIVRQLAPTGILLDAKAVDATKLREFLNKPDNHFDKLGNITG